MTSHEWASSILGARLAGLAAPDPGVGRHWRRPHRHALDRLPHGLFPAAPVVAGARAARRLAPGRHGGDGGGLGLGTVARQATGPAAQRTPDRGGAVRAGPGGGEPGEKRQRHQLPLGLVDLRWPSTGRVALGLGRVRRRPRSLLPRRSPHQWHCHPCPGPAGAVAWCKRFAVPTRPATPPGHCSSAAASAWRAGPWRAAGWPHQPRPTCRGR